MAETKHSHPKISVVIPAFNAAKTLPLTLDSLLSQTYQQLEIIVVNDGSTDNTLRIAEDYAARHKHIQVLSHDKNAGLFRTRLTGSDVATGDYLAFLDSDDTVSIDYYRTMASVAMEHDSDMVLAEVVWDDVSLNKKYISVLANDLPFSSLEGDDVFSSFMEQHGSNHNWHVAWNKLIDMKLWREARPYYDLITTHLVMTEDISISVPLWYFAKRVDRSPTSYNFYRRGDEGQSTTVSAMNTAKVEKNIRDVHTTFAFFEDFLKETKAEGFSEHLFGWKQLYVRFWYDTLTNLRLNATSRKSLEAHLTELAPYSIDATNINTHMQDISADWNDGLEKIKKAIAANETQIVSFDVFDTLIVRPLETPADLFRFMDVEFKKLHGNYTLLSFHDVRTGSEAAARVTHKHLEDITLGDIYQTMQELYGIDAKTADKLMRRELELELQFTRRRNTAYELFQLAKHLKKTVVITTDMYLPREAIESILHNAGYDGWDELYISSELNKTKHTGTAYAHIHKHLSAKPSHILHIGDNHHADIAMAIKQGIRAMHFPCTVEAMHAFSNLYSPFEGVGETVNGWSGRWYTGTKALLALVANKYFDNPFVNHVPGTIFNGSPSLMGYAGLGLHLYAVTNWLEDAITDKQYDNLVFLARDGYLPMESLELLQGSKAPTKYHYLPTSRKANVALSITTPDDVNHLDKFINVNRHTVDHVLKLLDPILDEQQLDKLLKSGKYTPKTRLLKISYPEFLVDIKAVISPEKIKSFRESFTKKYGSYFAGNVAIFDIGYSAKPEQVFSAIFNKPMNTYFIHSDGEGAERGLDVSKVSLNVFYDYFPSLGSELRELSLSQLSPSCVGYKVSLEGLQPLYDPRFRADYYEKFVVKALQTNALRFVKDVADTFGEFRHQLAISHQYLSLPYESIMSHTSGIDKDVFKPFEFEDDMGAGKILIRPYAEIQRGRTLHDALIGKGRTIKALALVLLDRAEFKHRVHQKTLRHKRIHTALRQTYRTARAVKRKLKGNN